MSAGPISDLRGTTVGIAILLACGAIVFWFLKA